MSSIQTRLVFQQCTSFFLQTNRKIDYIVAFDIIAYEDTSCAAHQTSHIVTFFPTCIAQLRKDTVFSNHPLHSQTMGCDIMPMLL